MTSNQLLLVATLALGKPGHVQALSNEGRQAKPAAVNHKICPECLRYPNDPNAKTCKYCKDEPLVDDSFGLNFRLNVKNMTAPVNWIALDPADPTVFAVAVESGTITLRSFDSKRPHKDLKVKGWARDVRFAPDGKTICVASVIRNQENPNKWVGKLSTFRLDSQEGFIGGPGRFIDEAPTATTFLSNRWFIASDVRGLLVTWNGSGYESPKPTSTIGSPVVCLARAHRVDRSTSLAEGKADGSIHLVDMALDGSGAAGEARPVAGERRILRLSHGKINAIVFSPSDDQVSASCDDGSIAIYDVRSERQRHLLRIRAKPHTKPDAAMSVCYLDDTHLAAGYASGRIVLWDIEHPEAPVIKEKAHPGMVLGLDYSGGQGVHRLVSGGGKSVKIWTVLGLGGQRG